MLYTGSRGASLVSLGFAVVSATLLLFGPGAAVATGLLSVFSSCLFPKRQPLYQLAFNIALAAVATFTAGEVFFFVNGGRLDLAPLRSFPAVLLFCLLCFLIDSCAVATVVALCTGQRPQRLWRERFLWLAPGYFVSTCVAALTILLFGRHLDVVLLFLTPVALLIYQSYSLYTARDQERQLRLEESQSHLEETRQHVVALEQSKSNLAELYLATIQSLALAIDAKDPFTHQHILRVQRYAVATAKHMGVGGVELDGITTGALLHDIGKLGVPDYVLLKPGRLTAEEFEKVKKHPEIGAAILDPVAFPWPVVPAVKYHHEKWDGTGYPEALAGERIPLPGRILAVADVYDALTSTRSYRGAWSHERALALIRDGAGKHFDPAIVDAFLSIVEDVSSELAQEAVLPAEDSAVAPTEKSEAAAREIQRASLESPALYELAQAFGPGLGLQETLDLLVHKLEMILPAAACLILLKGDGPEDLVARATVGIDQEFFAGSRVHSPGSHSSQVVRSGETYVGPFDPEDLLLSGTPAVPWTSLQSALIVPLAYEGEALGTVNLYRPDSDAFGPEDRQLLETIAERAASSLYNGLLLDRTRITAQTDP